MKNRIGVRSEYFNRKQAKGVAAHVKREFANDKNVIDPRYTAHNFGTDTDTYNQNYLEALQAMPDSVKNTLIDSVLVLPYERMKELTKECKKDGRKWQDEMDKAITEMAKEMEDEMGFTFIGYRMHLDEGHHDAEGKVVLNTHAHLHFANICTKDVVLEKRQNITVKDENGKAIKDPNNKGKWLYERDENGDVKQEVVQINLKGRAPLSLHQTRGSESIWARQQDIAAKHLKHLGFERGEKAEITKARNLKKKEHAERAIKRLEAEKSALEEQLNKLRTKHLEAVDAFINEREDALRMLIEVGIDLDEFEEKIEPLQSNFMAVYADEVLQAKLIESNDQALADVKAEHDAKPEEDKPFNFDLKFDALAAKLDACKPKDKPQPEQPAKGLSIRPDGK
jgi:hypothetical protein